ncbi:Chaperone protein DnaJ [Frankliniella fusca]|uniref:Chaperone protein DnaJ n=1 Tax=Frankliniella fusca TaxID=407009 RepID=A0AAE1HHP1_9NEOP|nr:Chaperone protein DnaJ [Frankliniella fusca]
MGVGVGATGRRASSSPAASRVLAASSCVTTKSEYLLGTVRAKKILQIGHLKTKLFDQLCPTSQTAAPHINPDC